MNFNDSQAVNPSGARHRLNELDLLVAVTERFDEVGLLVDVGAHVGSFAEEFARRGWEVIAIEASPQIHAELVERLAPYERADVVHAAATDTGGEPVEFFISAEYWGIHSLRPFHETHKSSVVVPTVRVSDLLRDRPRTGPLVIKVDTEGADLLVLRGIDWEVETPRIVVCEFMDERTAPHFGYVYTDMISFMEERGFVAYVSEWAPVEEPSRRGSGGGPFTHLQIVRSPLYHGPAWGNIFFVLPQDESLFEEALGQYLLETHRLSEQLVSAAAGSVDRLTHLEKSIANRERRILGLEDHLRVDREGLERRRLRISELELAVSQRDARIADLDLAIGQRDARRAELDTAIEQRNDRVKELNTAIRQRDSRINDLEEMIKRLNGETSGLRGDVARHTATIEQLTNEVANNRQRILRYGWTAGLAILICLVLAAALSS